MHSIQQITQAIIYTLYYYFKIIEDVWDNKCHHIIICIIFVFTFLKVRYTMYIVMTLQEVAHYISQCHSLLIDLDDPRISWPYCI